MKNKLLRVPAFMGRQFRGIIWTKEEEKEYIKQLQKKVQIEIGTAQVVGIFGRRGSGKSYTAKVMIEEYLKNNQTNAVVVIDPMGNECLECTMSEKLHEVCPELTCGNFQDGRKKASK